MTTLPDSPALKMIREFVAVGRVGFARPSSPEGDPDAQRALVKGIEILDDLGEPLDVSGPLVELLAPRAPFFDELVLCAIDAGVTQVVNIGAGYDDRALRFRRNGVTYFEIDLPHVVADKAARLADVGGGRSGPVLIAADLSVDDLGSLLAEAGHDAKVPTLFIAEHVLLFVDDLAVRRLLRVLSDLAAPKSLLALTVELHPEGWDSRQLVAHIDSTMFAGAGVMRSIQSHEGWAATLEDSGWCRERQDVVNALDHFALIFEGSNVQIRTAFVTCAPT